MSAVTQAEFARLHSVSRKTVTGWKQDGHLVVTADGQIDVEASNKKLSQRSTKSRGGAARGPSGGSPIAAKPAEAPPKPKAPAVPSKPKTPRPARPVPAAAPSPPQEEPEAETPEAEAKRLISAPGYVLLTKAEAETEKENYLARLRGLEYAQKSGEVVLVEDARRLLSGYTSRIKNKLLGIPTRIAPRVATIRDVEQVKAILDREIELVLNELAAEAHLRGPKRS